MIYIGELGGKRLHAFTRDGDRGALKPKQSVTLSSMPNHLHPDTSSDGRPAVYLRSEAVMKSFEHTSAVATYGNRLLIGSWVDHKLMLCGP